MDNALTAPATGNLWELNGQLFDLIQVRDEITDPDELAAIDSAIVDFVRQKVSEVDEIRRPILAMRDAAGVCRSEATRAQNQSFVWDRRADQIEAIVQQCMEAMEQAGVWKPKQTRKVVSPLGSFALRGNGGKRPVIISDEAMIPDQYRTAHITMPADAWKELIYDAGVIPANVHFEISRSRIEAALNEPCSDCVGAPDPRECESCGGSGLSGVPGAYLAKRGTSLVVR